MQVPTVQRGRGLSEGFSWLATFSHVFKCQRRVFSRNIEVMKQRLKDLWKEGAHICLLPGSTGELAKVSVALERHIHTHTHTPVGDCCQVRRCQAHWDKFRIQCLAQGQLKAWFGTLETGPDSWVSQCADYQWRPFQQISFSPLSLAEFACARLAQINGSCQSANENNAIQTFMQWTWNVW